MPKQYNSIKITCWFIGLDYYGGVQKTASLRMVGACSQNSTLESPPCRFQATDALALTLDTTTSRLSVAMSSYPARCVCAWKDGVVSETIARSATSSLTATVPMRLLAFDVQITAGHIDVVPRHQPSAHVQTVAFWFTTEQPVDAVNFGPWAMKVV